MVNRLYIIRQVRFIVHGLLTLTRSACMHVGGGYWLYLGILLVAFRAAAYTCRFWSKPATHSGGKFTTERRGRDEPAAIARALLISRPVVAQYLSDFSASGLTYGQIRGIADSELMTLFERRKVERSPKYETLTKLFPHYVKELKKLRLHWFCVAARIIGSGRRITVALARGPDDARRFARAQNAICAL